MTLADVAKRVGKLMADNSPAILSGIAVVGAVTTAVLAGKASYEAAQIIALMEGTEGVPEDRREQLKERVRLVWKLYTPAVCTGGLTVLCIVGSAHIGHRRAAALSAAYVISEKAFDEYRAKAVEKFGEAKHKAIVEEIAADHVRKDPPSNEIIVVSGDVLCRDDYSGRYFQSSVEKLNAAKNEINHNVINDFYASLTDFYYAIGLTRTGASDEVGWNADRLLELEFSTVLAEDGRPCLVVGFKVSPIRGYHRIN